MYTYEYLLKYTRMQVLTIINYTGFYLHQRFSVIKNQEADFFFYIMYIFTQLLGIFFSKHC